MDAIILDVGDLLPLGELWGTALGFVIIFTASVFAIGLASRNLAIGGMGSFLAFSYFATQTEIGLLETLMYVVLTLVIVGTAMKVWRLEGFGTE